MPGKALVSVARRSWRQLTSMRTALVLLFLLAVAAVPGSVLPQRNVASEKVTTYLKDHPGAGPWLDTFGFFDVYASPWFSAIYLLLFISLVGCLVPRFRSHAIALFRVPLEAPQRLDRLPAHAGDLALDGDRQATAQRLKGVLKARRFRVAVRENAGSTTVSAEKGYLKESGNLLFHFSLLAVLVCVAIGARYGWHGNRVLVAGPDQAFCNTLLQYDEHGLGARVADNDLEPFCVRLDEWHATYLYIVQPTALDAQKTEKHDGREWQQRLTVNEPVRLDRANVNLLGHGYAPVLRYTDKYGKSQTTVTAFLTNDGNLTSTGVATFPDVNQNPRTGTRDEKAQIGFKGTYLPTMADDTTTGVSVYPDERNPRLFLQPYQGELGFDAGKPLSVYTLDQRQIDAGRLKQFGPLLSLQPGDKKALPDGSPVEFVGTRPWISMSVRYDPGEKIVLVGMVALLLGLLGSLTGKRRRVWFRVTDDGAEAGGLPRSEYPGFQAEFDEIVRSSGLTRRELVGVKEG